MGEQQQLLRFMEERPEFIEAVVERTVSRFVERLLEERHNDLQTKADSAVEAYLRNVFTAEFLKIILESEGSSTKEKSLGNRAREEARQRVADIFRLQWQEIVDLKVSLRELRETIEGDSEWWRWGGEPPGGAE